MAASGKGVCATGVKPPPALDEGAAAGAGGALSSGAVPVTDGAAALTEGAATEPAAADGAATSLLGAGAPAASRLHTTHPLGPSAS
jgi:hypothetical protein